MQGFLFKDKTHPLFGGRPRWTGRYLYNLGRFQYSIQKFECADCAGNEQWWSSQYTWPFGVKRVLGPLPSRKRLVQVLDERYGRPALSIVRS